jgi:CheY-like chemotaxis protein
MSGAHHILVVEDSDESIAYMSEILEEHGYQYAVAQDGKAAMDAMRNKRPDLVLLDIMMPRKSGISVFQQMKRDPNLDKVPVVFVTGASEVTGVEMKTGQEKPRQTYDDDLAREFGLQLREQLSGLKPDGFLEKPVEPARLISAIESLLA